MANDTLLLILLILLIIIVLCLLALVIFILWRSGFLNSKTLSDPDMPAPSVIEAYHCVHHPENNAVATCAICEESICETCHKDWEGIHLCPQHFELYGLHTWLEIAQIKTSPRAPEKGHKLYHFKHKIWHDEKIPAYLVTYYKINVENDYVESWVTMYAREEDADQLVTRYQVISEQK